MAIWGIILAGAAFSVGGRILDGLLGEVEKSYEGDADIDAIFRSASIADQRARSEAQSWLAGRAQSELRSIDDEFGRQETMRRASALQGRPEFRDVLDSLSGMGDIVDFDGSELGQEAGEADLDSLTQGASELGVDPGEVMAALSGRSSTFHDLMLGTPSHDDPMVNAHHRRVGLDVIPV